MFSFFCRAFKSFKSCSATLLADCPLSSSDLEEIRAVYSTIEYMCQDQYDGMHCFIVMQTGRGCGQVLK